MTDSSSRGDSVRPSAINAALVRRAHWQLHFCVLVWGFTAILGKLITVPTIDLVWWRLLIVVSSLCLFPRTWTGLRQLSPRLIAIYAGIGVLIAAHWLTFYGAIRLANASVAVTCLAVAPVFLAVVEPFIARRRFDWRELLLGIAVIPGVALVVGGIPDDMHAGVAMGIFSTLLVAFFVALNKRYIEHADPVVVTGIELGAGLLFVTALVPWTPAGFAGLLQLPSAADTLLLLILGLGCTLLPFTLSLFALRRISAFSAQLAINLEPLYAIVLAALLLGEQQELGLRFYLGVGIVMATVFAHPLLTRRTELVAPDALAADAIADEAPQPVRVE